MVLLAVHVDDVARNAHVGGIVGVIHHDVQQIKPGREGSESRNQGVQWFGFGSATAVTAVAPCPSPTNTQLPPHSPHLDRMAGGSATLYLSGLDLS